MIMKLVKWTSFEVETICGSRNLVHLERSANVVIELEISFSTIFS